MLMRPPLSLYLPILAPIIYTQFKGWACLLSQNGTHLSTATFRVSSSKLGQQLEDITLQKRADYWDFKNTPFWSSIHLNILVEYFDTILNYSQLPQLVFLPQSIIPNTIFVYNFICCTRKFRLYHWAETWMYKSYSTYTPLWCWCSWSH